MPSIKFANILLETNPRSVSYPSLYVASDQPVVYDEELGHGVLFAKGEYDFTTYFNSLSVMKLQEYTSMTGCSLHLELKGAACDIQQTMGDAFAAHPIPVGDVHHLDASVDTWQSFDLPLTVTDDMVVVGFRIVTDGRVEMRDSYYTLELHDEPRNDVELVLSTTTFKKESFIINNINLVKKYILDSNDEIAKHFNMYVVDNGRTLDVDALNSEHIKIIPNDNVGGAGGFTRGMIMAMEQKPKATNILLMDDDVAVSPESIKRTYNLLCILTPEHRDAMISGAMLNYEIGEDQWEDTGFMTPEGTFAPAKPSLRLTKFEDIIYNEMFRPGKVIKYRYAAWWYCCIPIDVIEKNGLPLPFFVRCDDAEYGVRCGTEFITMNSLCVWHMSFHERYNAAVERYQTTRNTMIAQATTGFAPQSDFMGELENNIRLELKKFGYDNAELCLDAFEDFLKGPSFFSKPGRAEETFMAANRNKEQLVSFEELQKQADADPELSGFNIKHIDRQLIDGDKPRSLPQRLADLVTDNGQRLVKTPGEGYAVIPVLGWVYPAGVIRGKDKLVVIDWYNRKGAIRTKDIKRYEQIKKRYARDLKYYKQHGDRLRREYAESRPELTSVKFWKKYLKMD
ncbi:glycosyltransferase family protein [Bifidobacterium choloepi]|uniref:Glycosyltransferase family 2 protein n=1 Tax=Bifidobacterium choloepi TaxID=2614131 RepID=A0A6I5N1J5_9BIFI|nr:glycosyltransferase [Bifidobacterium choloepi]NEG70487.1 glycosyltransferase family 2 protein [Bifidobacterium choloepi]